jgi:hypothetical protein
VVFFLARYTRPKAPLLMGLMVSNSSMDMEGTTAACGRGVEFSESSDELGFTGSVSCSSSSCSKQEEGVRAGREPVKDACCTTVLPASANAEQWCHALATTADHDPAD